MTLSIIVPVFNVEDYLDECIKNLLKFNHKNIEFLLINDGSTDTSGKICDYYSNLDSRIRVVHKRNAGLSATRNLGIDLASKDYLTFIDSDDLVNISIIEKILEDIESKNIDVVKGRYKRFQKYEDIKLELDRGEFFEVILNDEKTGMDYIVDSLNKNSYEIVACTGIYKTSFLKRNNIKFPLDLYFEDHDFTFNLLLNHNANISTYDAIPYYYYRFREGSITNSIGIDKLKSFIKIIENQIDYTLNFTNKEKIDLGYKLIALTIDHLIQFVQNNLSRNEKYLIRKELKNIFENKKISTSSFIYNLNFKNSFKIFSFMYMPLILDISYLIKRKIKNETKQN